MSPDAFVQMGILGAWFGLYGRIECVYEPAMTKAFLHGRTEAIRTVQKESVDFIKVGFFFYLFRLSGQVLMILFRRSTRMQRLRKRLLL